MPPLVTYSIGALEFVSAVGSIPEPQARIQRLTRAGVTYASYRNIGIGGREPFTIVTRRDVVDIDDGRTVAGTYAALVGAAVQQFIWADHDFDTDSLRVAVLGVEPEDIRSILQWCGSFDDANSKAVIQARWTLEFRDI